MDPTWQEKLRYQFDNFIARGTAALIGALGLLSLFLIFVMAAVISLGGIRPSGTDESLNFWEAAWQSLMRTLDAGTMGGDEGWSFRFVMFLVTLGGVFIISTLIGALTSGIENKMEELRKGRSRVIENGHTVILGWSSQVFTILSELIIANENQKDSCIVVLGNKDKVEMEDEIRSVIGETGRTRIVCRTGNPIDMNDLDLVSLQTSRSVVVLAAGSHDPDAQTIKMILAITNNPNRRAEPYHIVAEIKDPKNVHAAKLAGNDEVELVLTGDLISRIIAQTCRQSGLSIIYTELLDFGGDEIYFKEEPALVGKTFHEALFAYKTSTVLGLAQNGAGVRLNPPMDTRIQAGDRIIAISADDDTIILDHPAESPLQAHAIVCGEPGAQVPERTLILGWNWRVPFIINELDHYVAPGSEIVVTADDPHGAAKINRLCSNLIHQKIAYQQADTTDRRVLESICPECYDHVIVLSYSDTKEVQEADACTLMTLLHLRDMAEQGNREISIVSEMLNLQNRTLAEVTRADDFIVSEKLMSLIMTQVAENKAINAVFTDIFDPDGSELYLKAAGQYVQLETPVNFFTVTESAARRGEVAIGYRLKAFAGDAANAYGVILNPDKTGVISFSPEDRIVVLAEN